MKNFQYYTPTRVVFGRNTEEQTGKLVKAEKGKKVLIHFGGGSVVKSGLTDRVCRSLKAAGIEYVTLGGVVPNPRLSKVYEGVKLCREENVDFILAVGGGSVIDSAKAIGYGVCYDGDVWDIYTRKALPPGCLPMGAVLTIAAAGSEMSESSVITNEEGNWKRGFSSDLSRCRFAILNPELTFSLPAYQTASGCVDILLHTMERYFSDTESGSSEVIDEISEGILRAVIHNAGILVKSPSDYNARAEIMWASSLSHNGLTGDRSTGDWACHQLEHEISGMFDVAHGAGLAAIWGSWARYVYQENPARFARFAVKVMGCPISGLNTEETALAGIHALENFFHSLSMPTSIRELGIAVTEEQLVELADKCSFHNTRTIGGFRVLNRNDMLAIYKTAR